MAYIDVKKLAELAGVSVTRLLVQMKAAGLPQTKAVDMVLEEEKEKLLSFLRNKTAEDADNPSTPATLSLRRKSVSTLKINRGTTGSKTVNVEVRKKRVSPILSYKKPIEASANTTTLVSETIPLDPSALSSSTAGHDGFKNDLQVKPSLPAESSPVSENNQRPHNEFDNQAAEAENSAINKKTLTEIPAKEANNKDISEKDAIRADITQTESQPIQSKVTAQTNISHPSDTKNTSSKKDIPIEIEKNDKTITEAEEKIKAKKPVKSKISLTQEKTTKKLLNIKHINLNPNDDLEEVAAIETEKFIARKPKKLVINKPISISNRHSFNKPVEQIKKEIQLTGPISVADLAHQLSCKAAMLIKQLMKMGNMVTINHVLDLETAIVLIEDLGHKAVITEDKNFEDTILKQVGHPTGESPRPPVVTVMGHVDHGKTSLLDYIRRTKVASGEAGGITQHIGAYQVETKHGKITFIDTPGHAAFTKMRARGTDVTDIVILVVAGDDSVMPQTEEAIQHAQAAGVPIIVAINKIDKPQADPERIKNELANKGVIAEDWGGEAQFIKVSAHTGEGIEDLLEAVSLQAEMLALTVADKGPARGAVIESKVDSKRGVLSTLLVQAGTLKHGDLIVAGFNYGRARALSDEHAHNLRQATPSKPVEILGLDGAPDVGEKFYVVTTEKQARSIIDHRKQQAKLHEESLKSSDKLANIFSINGQNKILNLVVKADVRGSLEAIKGVLAELNNDEVQVKIVSSGIGGINESDVNLAKTSNAIVVGFNVRADSQARIFIENEAIELRYYSIIYDLIDDVKKALEGMLSPELREKILGVAEVRDVFSSSKFGQIAGCMVIEGMLHRNKRIRVLRNNVVIYEGELESLRRFKEDAQQVRSGTECGIGVKNYNDVRAGDKIEVFDTIEVSRKL